MELNLPDREDDAQAFLLKISKVSSVPLLWGIYKRATSAYWIPDMVNVAGDSSDWNHLDQALKTIVLKTIAFLTTNEKVLKGDLDVNSHETRFFFCHKAAMKNIHLEMYSRLIDAFDDPNEPFLREINDVQYSRGAIDLPAWSWEWVQNEKLPMNLRLVALAVSEEIFTSILSVVKDACEERNVLKGLRNSFELISRDKDFSVEFTCELFTYCDKPEESIVHSLVQEAVEIHSYWERSLLGQTFPGYVINSYAAAAANRLLEKLGYSKVENFESMHLHRKKYKKESKVEIKSAQKKFKESFEDLYKSGVRHLDNEKMEELAKFHEVDYLSVCLWFLQKEGVEI